jgi:hypothetical protein
LKSHLHHESLPQVISVRESIQDAVAAIEQLYNLESAHSIGGASSRTSTVERKKGVNLR